MKAGIDRLQDLAAAQSLILLNMLLTVTIFVLVGGAFLLVGAYFIEEHRKRKIPFQGTEFEQDTYGSLKEKK